MQTHLSNRDNANSRDVRDAIGNLVARMGAEGLPVPLSLSQVAHELLSIDQTDPDTSIFVAYKAGPSRSRYSTFLHDLRPEHDTFRTGYKLFGEVTGLPVVPVCQWFFDNVHDTSNISKLTDEMTVEEVQMSETRAHSPTAGVVVFPHGSSHGLLGLRLLRMQQTTEGTIQANVNTVAGSALAPSSLTRLTRAQSQFINASPNPLLLNGGMAGEWE